LGRDWGCKGSDGLTLTATVGGTTPHPHPLILALALPLTLTLARTGTMSQPFMDGGLGMVHTGVLTLTLTRCTPAF
jgi:hypothetical protein